jgi:hypothetical protein
MPYISVVTAPGKYFFFQLWCLAMIYIIISQVKELEVVYFAPFLCVDVELALFDLFRFYKRILYLE